MVSFSSGKIKLPSYYDAIAVETCDKALSVDTEVTRWLAEEERRRGKRPTSLFTNIVEYPGAVLLGNPYPRSVLFSALQIDERNWQENIAKRLKNDTFRLVYTQPHHSWLSLSGIDTLPVLRNRPGDGGRYITSAVTVTKSLDGRVNLGVYRIQVVNGRQARIFFDPRTDAYRNWKASINAGKPLRVSIFIGANPVYMLVAASHLPTIESDFNIVAQLLERELELTGDPPVPLDAQYIISGEVTDKLELEGPFAEFKGYYVDARPSPVLVVKKVLSTTQPVYPFIVTGAESGLTLSAIQNEYLMYTSLVDKGFSVKAVHYPLYGRGEFLTLIETNKPSLEIIQAALSFDVRTKVVICGPDLGSPWDAIATHGFQVYQEPYFRKGQVEGKRIGLILDQPPTGARVEY